MNAIFDGNALLKYLFFCFFLTAFLAVSDASATEPWRVLDNTNEGSTSDCIGDPKTPLCAVETVEACFKRGDWDLCERAGLIVPKYDRGTPIDYSLLHYFRYRVVGRGVVRKTDIPPALKFLKGLSMRAGDLALLVKWQDCPPIEQCVMGTINHPSKSYGEGCRTFHYCADVNPLTTYILRLNGREWHVLRDSYDPLFQGDFWNRK